MSTQRAHARLISGVLHGDQRENEADIYAEEEDALEEDPRPKLTPEELKRKIQKQLTHRQRLRSTSDKTYSKEGSKYSLRGKLGVGSAMFMAHFNYICDVRTDSLAQDAEKYEPEEFWKKHSIWGLESYEDKTVKTNALQAVREGCQLLQLLVARQLVEIVSVSGNGYCEESLSITLKSLCPYPLRVEIVKGTVFQHIDWVHKQNLMVYATTAIDVLPAKTVTQTVNAYCMNLTCSCSCGESMQVC